MHVNAWGRVVGGFWMLALLLVGLPPSLQASETPYFQVISADAGKVERLPLLQTQADVQIAGTIAAVQLRQRFENRGQVPIEAVYVFPASIHAAVTGLSLRIGEREVRGVIREKQKAAAEYTAAKESGRNTALLEQQSEGIFRMRLANILPGDRIDVVLSYSELLLPREGVYEFFLPTTFASEGGHYDVRAQGQRSSAEAEVTDYSFALRAALSGPLPFARIDSPSHRLAVQRSDAQHAHLQFADEEVKASTRDFVLRFSYAGNEVASGLLLYPGADENFFLLTLQPPATVVPDQVPPREYLFVVDVSGSMHGAPLDLAKVVMRELLAGLRAQDRFNVVLFAGGSTVLDERGSLPGTADNRQRAFGMIDRSEGGGSTDLQQALLKAYAVPRPAGMARSVVVVTDGGIMASDDVSRLIRANLGQASVFAFGVGASVDKGVIQRLARAGTGEAVMIENMDEGRAQAQAFRRYIEQPLLTQVEASFEGFDAYDVTPTPIPDLFAQRPVVLIGKYRGAAQGQIRLRGIGGRGPYAASIAVAGGNATAANAPLRALWARQALADRLDFAATSAAAEPAAAEEQKAFVTKIGLDYSLLTPFTAFVAVDTAVRTDQPAVGVNQPTPQRASAVASYGAGSGNALLLAAQAQPLLAQAVAGVAQPVRDVSGRRFAEQGGALVDLSYRSGQPLLRIRRDSAAYRRLLELRPDLRQWLELGERVLLNLGRYAVLIDARGFSDYPERSLRQALAPTP
ncbi:Ca-activated chloride channel family protein [Tahibacter aquaticus]|uniref:Ca-activated chloride channel family protein n=1 Tax=Tahibacter aquaticus TaxID=520092 RepID=A0A4V3DLE5_9GAMM|nr:VIT domain-containing protein [Tahibacter aquaticus]TDR38879.1 Ca-activated chloride channel family protein [Tahibacter aquaticus]